MHWIIQFIVQHRNLSSLFLTTVLSLWMLSAENQRQQQITRLLTMTVFYPFQFTLNQITRAKNIYAENRVLREELTQLKTSLSLWQEQAAENNRLRELLGFSESFSFQLHSARVIAREPSHEFKSLVINAGVKHGIQYNMPVITREGVVGKIIQVMNTISLVQLLRDPSGPVSTLVKRSRFVGILETENGRTFYAKHRTHADVEINDTIVTSGLGGIYPKGLPVGIVKEIEKSSDPLFKKVKILPMVDFERCEEVFVLKLSPQWSSYRDELESVERK